MNFPLTLHFNKSEFSFEETHYDPKLFKEDGQVLTARDGINIVFFDRGERGVKHRASGY